MSSNNNFHKRETQRRNERVYHWMNLATKREIELNQFRQAFVEMQELNDTLLVEWNKQAGTPEEPLALARLCTAGQMVELVEEALKEVP